MPESSYGEHLQRAGLILNESRDEYIRETLAFMVYECSNNLSNGPDVTNNQWRIMIDMLYAGGIINRAVNLWSLDDRTTKAFLVKLFRPSLIRCFDNVEEEQLLATVVLRWLLSCGYSPDRRPAPH